MKASTLAAVALGVILAPFDGPHAAPAVEVKLEACVAMKDGTERLNCFDEFAKQDAKKKLEAREAANQLAKEESAKAIRWRIRDSGTVSAAGLADIGSKPARFEIGRADGSSSSSVRMAAVGIFQAIDQPGFFDTWEPFIAVAWDRDSAAKTPKDQRQLIGGITGNLFNVGGTGTAVIATTRLGFRNDLKRNSDAIFLNLHADIVHLAWVNDDQTESTNSFIPIPYLGLVADSARTSPTSATDGHRFGAYAGIKSEFQLFALAPRLGGTASVQWFKDWQSPPGVNKRSDRFIDIGVTYHLVDPKAKRGFVPSIGLTRQLGTDPVTGRGPANRTVLGLGVRFD